MGNNIDTLIQIALLTLRDTGDCEPLLAKINKGDSVNSWVYGSEPFPSEDSYYSLSPIHEFFHEDEDLLDYYDKDYLQQNTDWHRLWRLGDMASKIDCDQCSSIYYVEINDVVLSAEANLHGQNGFYFDNLRLFDSLDDLFLHYKDKGNLVFRDKTFYSHNEQELLALNKAHIESRL